MNMTRDEVRFTRYGEMLDLIACYNIEKGNALPKKKELSFMEVIALQ